MTYKEQLQRIVREYQDADQPWPATCKDIAAWALDNKKWQAQRDTLLNRCADELSDAMREEFYTDPQGRRVRTKHAAKSMVDGEQAVLWDDIRTAPYEHMLVAFQQRRQQIVGDCHRLKLDVDSYNENTNQGPTIQMPLDFGPDVADIEALERLERLAVA